MLHGCVKKQTIYVHIIMLIRIVTWLSFMAICRSAWNRSRSCQQISLWDVTLTNSSIPVSFTFGLFWWWGLVALCRNFLQFKRQGQASQTTLTLVEGYQKSGSRTVHPFTFGTNYYTTPTFQQIIINFCIYYSYLKDWLYSHSSTLYPELTWKQSKSNFNFPVMAWEV